MESQRDSNVGVYFIAMIFIGLALGGIIAANQTGSYWDRFCGERMDIEACQRMADNRQKAIGELIKLGDKHGSHAAIPGLPPVEEAMEEQEVDVTPTEAAAEEMDGGASPAEPAVEEN
jgi:hypothetical protein